MVVVPAAREARLVEVLPVGSLEIEAETAGQ
jgi:hypothetical protein